MVLDDAVSSGTTMKAAWEFLEGDEVGADVIAAGVFMMQGRRWEKLLGAGREVRGVFECPLLRKVEDGWDVRE